jgi:hypothetical protein
MSGSILGGTAEHRLISIETDLAVTADAPVDEVAEIVDQAERMCFVLDAINRPHEVNRQVSVNGQRLTQT